MKKSRVDSKKKKRFFKDISRLTYNCGLLKDQYHHVKKEIDLSLPYFSITKQTKIIDQLSSKTGGQSK